MPVAATPAFLDALAARLPPGRLREAAPRYLEEPRGRWAGRAAAVATPGSTEEVATILRAASEARVAVLPYGGGTGLVGGQVCPDGPAPLILSLERMTAIRGLWPEENVLVAEAGAVIADIQKAAEAADRLFPLSYGSEGTARIGGALAVNSGGVNVLRYGNARELCLGIEAVLPDGRILHGLQAAPEGQHRLRPAQPADRLRRDAWRDHGGQPAAVPAPRPHRHGAVRRARPCRRPVASGAPARPGGRGRHRLRALAGTGLAFLDEAGMGLRQPFDPIPDWVALVELGLPLALDPQANSKRCSRPRWRRARSRTGLVAQGGQQRGLLAPARRGARGQPQDRSRGLARHLPAAVRNPRLPRPRRPGGGGAGAAARQRLRASGRRQPALQPLPAAGPRGA
jgi:hypothetical protein